MQIEVRHEKGYLYLGQDQRAFFRTRANTSIILDIMQEAGERIAWQSIEVEDATLAIWYQLLIVLLGLFG